MLPSHVHCVDIYTCSLQSSGSLPLSRLVLGATQIKLFTRIMSEVGGPKCIACPLCVNCIFYPRWGNSGLIVLSRIWDDGRLTINRKLSEGSVNRLVTESDVLRSGLLRKYYTILRRQWTMRIMNHLESSLVYELWRMRESSYGD